MPSVVTMAHPEISVFDLINRDSQPVDTSYDSDFIEKSDSNDAIELVADGLDNLVFKEFYKLSYFKNGNVSGEDNIHEDLKLQIVMNMVIDDTIRILE